MFGNKHVRNLAGQALASLFEDDETVPVMRSDIRSFCDIGKAEDLPTVYFWQKEDSGDVVLSINETRLANLVALTIPYHDKHFPPVLTTVRDVVMKAASNSLSSLLREAP